jgi:hypothetical protein
MRSTNRVHEGLCLALVAVAAWTWAGLAGPSRAASAAAGTQPSSQANAQAQPQAQAQSQPSTHATTPATTQPATHPATQPNLKEKPVMAGAYYFDGWAGHRRQVAPSSQPAPSSQANDANEAWARNAPMQLTRRLALDFADREPVWGWRDDSLEIMERQIDLAADAGIEFFAFCWYWQDNGKAINPKAIQEDPKHTCLDLFLKARNNARMKFCLLVANHQGFEIKGAENWKAAGEFWMPYLKSPRCVTVGGKPLIIVYGPKGGDKEGFDAIQASARQAGLSGVALAGCGELTPEMGFTHRTHYNYIPGYWDGSVSHPFAELVAAHEEMWKGTPEQPYMPIVISGWDKRPWERSAEKGEAARYYPDRTPEQFAAHVADAIAWMDKNPEQTTAERIFLIYAWNEFGEGGYIAPTKGDPDGKYLKALRSVLKPGAKSGG